MVKPDPRPRAVRLMTVCTGNICRSPMAEVIFGTALAQAGLVAEVDSTGVSDEEHGHGLDRRAGAVLRAHGYRPRQHRARQIRATELGQRDLIVAMTFGHYRVLERLAADVERPGLIRMVRQFDPTLAGQPASPQLDVDDPWWGGPREFEQTLAELEAAAPGIVAWAEAFVASVQDTKC